MLGEHMRIVHLIPRVFLTEEIERAQKVALERNERAEKKAKKRATRAAQGQDDDDAASSDTVSEGDDTRALIIDSDEEDAPVGITAVDVDEQDGAGPSGINTSSGRIVIPALDETNISSTLQSRSSSPVTTSTPVTSSRAPTAPTLFLRRSGHMPVLPIPATTITPLPSRKLPPRPPSAQPTLPAADPRLPPRSSSTHPSLSAIGPKLPATSLLPAYPFARLVCAVTTSSATTLTITTLSATSGGSAVIISPSDGPSRRISRTSGGSISPTRSRMNSGGRKRSLGDTSMAGNVSLNLGEPSAQMTAPTIRSSSRHRSPTRTPVQSRVGSPTSSRGSSIYTDWSPSRYSTKSRTRSPSRSVTRTPSPRRRTKHLGVGKKSSENPPPAATSTPSVTGAMGPPLSTTLTRAVSFMSFYIFICLFKFSCHCQI